MHIAHSKHLVLSHSSVWESEDHFQCIIRQWLSIATSFVLFSQMFRHIPVISVRFRFCSKSFEFEIPQIMTYIYERFADCAKSRLAWLNGAKFSPNNRFLGVRCARSIHQLMGVGAARCAFSKRQQTVKEREHLIHLCMRWRVCVCMCVSENTWHTVHSRRNDPESHYIYCVLYVWHLWLLACKVRCIDQAQMDSG